MASIFGLGWFGLALAAAALWGLQYALWGQILRFVSPVVGLWWYCVFSVIAYGVYLGLRGVPLEGAKLVADSKVLGLLALVTLLGFAANVLMMSGFKVANPTVVGMVTASYPLFTALFVAVLFRTVEVNLPIVIGFGLIIAGVGLVGWGRGW